MTTIADLHQRKGEHVTEDFRAIGDRVRNWGRWGDDDEIGTLNLVTPERLVAAAALVRQGKVFDLGIPFDRNGPQTGADRTNPLHFMTEVSGVEHPTGSMRFADDWVVMPLQAGSQWDALAHIAYDGLIYNGYPDSVITTRGAQRNSIDKIAKGVAGRGVLLDIARLKGVPWLQRGEVITPGDLDAAAEAEGVEIRPGDIVCVRTGWRARFLSDGDPKGFHGGAPGLGLACAEWLHGHDIAAVTADNFGVEVIPSENPDEPVALHMILIRDMGMTLGEILDFEELAEDCAADGVWEFFFAGPPIKFTHAVGSPINPLAFK